MSDEYIEHLKRKHEQWESLCVRCGACCGAFDDPCLHLNKDDNGKYYCDIYDNRLGPRETVSGDKFNCVPIEDLCNRYWKNDHLCAYKKILRAPWLKP